MHALFLDNKRRPIKWRLFIDYKYFNKLVTVQWSVDLHSEAITAANYRITSLVNRKWECEFHGSSYATLQCKPSITYWILYTWHICRHIKTNRLRQYKEDTCRHVFMQLNDHIRLMTAVLWPNRCRHTLRVVARLLVKLSMMMSAKLDDGNVSKVKQ